MRLLPALCLSFFSTGVFACGAPVCLVDPDSLPLVRIITFEDVQSGAGPGRHLDEVLPLDGAAFGERFAGQFVTPAQPHPHDQIMGQALAPLTILPGAEGQNLSVVHFQGNTVINGYGTAGFPRRGGQGEGAIAVLFDNDQSDLAFDLRGGEAGVATVTFLRRDGSVAGCPLGQGGPPLASSSAMSSGSRLRSAITLRMTLVS